MLNAFHKEIELRAEELTNELESIYFGGGSPSLISPQSIDHLINVLMKKFNLHKKIEITIIGCLEYKRKDKTITYKRHKQKCH